MGGATKFARHNNGDNNDKSNNAHNNDLTAFGYRNGGVPFAAALCSGASKVGATRALRAEKFICALMYTIGAAYVGTNLFMLLYRMDTIYYLRIYHLAVGAVMLASGAVMLAFMWRARDTTMLKLRRPHALPRPTLISAFLLTAGVVMGYAYLFVFNFAFSNCDKLIDATSVDEQWQEAVFALLMIAYCLLSLIYILQRSYYGSIDTCFDMFTRQCVNVVLTIVWVKIVIFKGYHSYQELCQRKEISGYWCPIVKRSYGCDPERQLHGTQKIWHYLHKGLLSSAIISCASEFFPVMLVGHWLACGRAEERADELIRRREEKKSVRRMLHGMMGNVSQAYGVERRSGGAGGGQLPPLAVGRWTAGTLNAAAWLTAGLALARWVVGFYFAINFDRMHASRSMADDFVEFATSCAQLALFVTLFKWSLSVEMKRFDAHHTAESRGDLILIVGSAACMSLKLLLQIFELNFQRADGFLRADECAVRVLSLAIVNASEWFQFLCLRRVMALHCEDVHATRHFLPSVALAAITANWVGFGMTFFETNTIKYQLSKPDFHFSQPTLISMIFTQTIYPADYLFMFTAAGCWTDVLLRYFEMGFFQLGQPLLLDDCTDFGDDNSLTPLSSASPAGRKAGRRKASVIADGAPSCTACRKSSSSLYLRPDDAMPSGSGRAEPAAGPPAGRRASVNPVCAILPFLSA